MTSGELGGAKNPLRMDIDKRFFVSMLTRDIEVTDAILDLLDNCLDGIIRTAEISDQSKKPYRGYGSKITINANEFRIEDNCGGIQKDLIKKAFGIGKTFDPDTPHKTIGVYGIGMKRAIFKMALDATVQSHSSFGFEVRIDEKWLKDQNNWKLDYHRKKLPFTGGTKIFMSKLRPEISSIFANNGFVAHMADIISRHYAVILDKGFRVELNGDKIEPTPLSILVAEPKERGDGHPSLMPYMLDYAHGNVRARMWVGMYRSIPSSEDEEEKEADQRQKRDNSGWTIICNDRAIVSNDTSIHTGWGEAGVPRFHPQFIGIRGILVMESDYPLELPLTTTKRGLDGNSELYLTLKEYMRIGTKHFTSFTNHWKSDREQVRKLFEESSLMEYSDLYKLLEKSKLVQTRNLQGARQYTPNLPTPEPTGIRRISFVKHKNKISKVAEYLFEDVETSPSEVGEACFDEIYSMASKK